MPMFAAPLKPLKGAWATKQDHNEFECCPAETAADYPYDKVSIYAFIRPPGPAPSGQKAEEITLEGPNIKAHERHFLQQSIYTIYGNYCGYNKGIWEFTPMKEEFERYDPKENNDKNGEHDIEAGWFQPYARPIKPQASIGLHSHPKVYRKVGTL
jgi:hypothetical protein